MKNVLLNFVRTTVLCLIAVLGFSFVAATPAHAAQSIQIDSAEWLNSTTIRFHYSENTTAPGGISLDFVESDGSYHSGAKYYPTSATSGYVDFESSDPNDLYYGADAGYTRYYALENGEGFSSRSNIIRLAAYVVPSHNQPVTSISYSSGPDGQGDYPNPVSFTLAATADTGYTISQSYYTVDGGNAQTYSSAVQIAGSGAHTITYWSVDNTGLEETPHHTASITLQHQGIHIDSAEWLNATTIRFHYSQNTYAPGGITLDFVESDGSYHSGARDYSTSATSGYVDLVAGDSNDLYYGADAGYTRYYALVGDGGSFADKSNIIRLPQYVAPTAILSINAGGDTSGNYVADKDYSGGSTYTSSASVDTSGVTNPAPQSVYQTTRYGNFSYTIPNLTSNGAYTLRLHFNELYWTAPGKRVFNVAVNGTNALTNFDIYQAAGGTNKAVVEQVPATADSNGNITVQFTSNVDNALVNGIELYDGTLTSPSPTPTPTPVSSFAVAAGGSGSGNYVADTDYTGGSTYSSNASVDTSGVTNPAPQSVYQAVRYGNMSYTIPTYSPNATYHVRLHFNELYWGTDGSDATGKRVFNVAINGTQVLNNFDIYQAAGGANKAVVEQYDTTTDANGYINIGFTNVTDNAMVNGIEVSQ